MIPLLQALFPDKATIAFPIVLPPQRCANCATTRDVAAYDVTYTRTRWWLVTSSEYTFTLQVSACPACRATLTRRRMAPIARAVIGAMGAVALWSVFLPAALQSGNELLFDALLPAIAIGALLGAFWPPRKPERGQSSAYQPVRLLGTRMRFRTAEATRVRLGFTSAVVRAEFEAANRARIASGELAVVACTD